jgi:hypothetical protein
MNKILIFLLLPLLTGECQADLAMGLEAVEAAQWNKALTIFRSLATDGDPNAQVNLGNMYMRGLGVQQDYVIASNWFAKSAHQGNITAQEKLGIMFYWGLGNPTDHAEAALWFLRAAEQGSPGAAMILADLYERGDGVKTSPQEAYLWYSIAADLGRTDAESQRERIADILPPSEMNQSLTKLNVWRNQNKGTGTSIPDHEPPDRPVLQTAKFQDTRPENTTVRKSRTAKPKNTNNKAMATSPAQKSTREVNSQSQSPK